MDTLRKINECTFYCLCVKWIEFWTKVRPTSEAGTFLCAWVGFGGGGVCFGFWLVFVVLFFVFVGFCCGLFFSLIIADQVLSVQCEAAHSKCPGSTTLPLSSTIQGFR